jgi:hypothetical protein
MIRLVTMRDALSLPQYFGTQLAGDSWVNWRAVLLALAAEPLEPDEGAILQRLTGRQRWPLGRVSEFWGIWRPPLWQKPRYGRLGRMAGRMPRLPQLGAW